LTTCACFGEDVFDSGQPTGLLDRSDNGILSQATGFDYTNTSQSAGCEISSRKKTDPSIKGGLFVTKQMADDELHPSLIISGSPSHCLCSGGFLTHDRARVQHPICL
jgi:hypothetical protein